MPVKHSHDIKPEAIPEGTSVTRQVLISSDEGPNFAMRRFEIQPGGRMPLHINEVEHEQYVLTGRAKIGIGDQVYDVKQGDVVFIPAKVPHFYATIGDEPFAFLCMVPNQEDKTTILEEKRGC